MVLGMKTDKQLYPQVVDFGNLYMAYRAARQGKLRQLWVWRGTGSDSKYTGMNRSNALRWHLNG